MSHRCFHVTSNLKCPFRFVQVAFAFFHLPSLCDFQFPVCWSIDEQNFRFNRNDLRTFITLISVSAFPGSFRTWLDIQDHSALWRLLNPFCGSRLNGRPSTSRLIPLHSGFVSNKPHSHTHTELCSTLISSPATFPSHHYAARSITSGRIFTLTLLLLLLCRTFQAYSTFDPVSFAHCPFSISSANLNCKTSSLLLVRSK